jgi:hypothetical protein
MVVVVVIEGVEGLARVGKRLLIVCLLLIPKDTMFAGHWNHFHLL